jgi:outer membrane protein assembly factor BamB
VCAEAPLAPEIVAFDARTGARVWTATGPEVPLLTSIADGIICGAVASKTNNSGLVALNASTGKVAWTTNVAGLASTWTGSGMVLAAATSQPRSDTEPGTLVALEAQTGRRLWTHDFPGGIPMYLQQVGTTILTATIGGEVSALDSTTGATLWSYTEPKGNSLMFASPVAGKVYLVNLSGEVLSLQA